MLLLGLKKIVYSLPIQLFILHFRKYQVLLFFWYILFAVINGGFMKQFGADALFFLPEYLGSVNLLAAFITGISLGFFVMSWNITSFILHSKRIKFLAASSAPFLKYCINNSLLPLLFIFYYFTKLFNFDQVKELMPAGRILLVILSIALGFILFAIISLGYFFGAGKTIEWGMAAIVKKPIVFDKHFAIAHNKPDEFGLKVWWYFGKNFKIKKVRSVQHYRQDFLERIFKRHHLAAIVSIVLAFIGIAITGFLQDYAAFEIPAASSILIVFALLIAVIGALSYFLQSWSLPAVIMLVILLNILYKHELIDPRNKAYGLNYGNKSVRPTYNKQSLAALCSPVQTATDRANMITILNNWKAKQSTNKPVLVFINVSGGGLRSAAFCMNALQQTDSITHGLLMKNTFMISGASGGMLAAAYYRELYSQSLHNNAINIYDKKYAINISKDLLNPVFTSLMARDIFAPIQKFTVGNQSYIKDRGYAFEKKLGQNTEGLLNIQLKDNKEKEEKALIPLMIFDAVIKADARKVMISTQPISFMMKPFGANADSSATPDAVDFCALFTHQQPLNLRMLTALRMNATFPYILPNVWLPSTPVIDVMDAGLRDNFGQETTLRFIDNFKGWIKENTSGILIIQLKDRAVDNWNMPLADNSISDMITKPATMLQHNWFNIQNYYYQDEFAYLQTDTALQLKKVTLVYKAEKEERSAALNFHLSVQERQDVFLSFKSNLNQTELNKIVAILK